MMLLLNTHGKVEKDSTFEKSKKHENMMERLDYLYGADRKMSFRSFDIHLLSYEEMKSAMAEQGHVDEEMFTSTLEIMNKIEDYDVKSGLDLLPVQYLNPDKELKDLAMQGLVNHKLDKNEEYILRLEEELKVVGNNMKALEISEQEVIFKF